MWLFEYIFSSILQILYVEVRISRSTMYLIESLGIRDNKSRLYLEKSTVEIRTQQTKQ